MSLNIGELKQEEIRRKVSILIDNKEEVVTIKNAIGKTREELLHLLDEKSKSDSETAPLELTKEILVKLTDLEIDSLGELEEVINNPRAELSMIIHEVNEIMQEIQVQYWTSQIRQMNQSVINLLMTESFQKAEVISNLAEKVKNTKTPVTLLEKGLHKDISKMTSPKRGNKNAKNV